MALNESLDMILSEGIENLWRKHALVARAMRAGIKAIGLELFTRDPSNVLTAIRIPDGIDGGALINSLKRNGIFPAGGQAQLKGKIIRIAHIGYLDEYDVLSALSGVELSLKDVGFSFTPGDSVKAAQEVLVDRW